jgi:hypothetical protein
VLAAFPCELFASSTTNCTAIIVSTHQSRKMQPSVVVQIHCKHVGVGCLLHVRQTMYSRADMLSGPAGLRGKASDVIGHFSVESVQ